MRWVKLTLPSRMRRRCPLMTSRLSNMSLTGISRTLVAVGIVSDSSMFLTIAAAGPRMRLGSGSVGSNEARAGSSVVGVRGRSDADEIPLWLWVTIESFSRAHRSAGSAMGAGGSDSSWTAVCSTSCASSRLGAFAVRGWEEKYAAHDGSTLPGSFSNCARSSSTSH